MGFEKSGILVQLSPGAKTGFTSSKRPDRIWVPLSFQMNRNRGRLSRRWSGLGLELATHLHLVSRLRMCSDIPSFIHTPARRSPRQLHFHFTNHSSALVVDTNSLLQGCINPRCQAAQTINVVTWRPYICRSYVIFFATRILKWLPDFWKICAPLAYRHSLPATLQSDNDRMQTVSTRVFITLGKPQSVNTSGTFDL
jgi:hypothetical protein